MVPWLTGWLTRFSAQPSPSYASQNCKEKTWHIWSHGHELTFKWSINHVQSGFFEHNRIVKFWKVLSTCFSIKVFIGLSRGCDRVYPPFLWKKIEERHLINLWNRISFSQFENISLSVPTGALYVTMQHYILQKEANDTNHPWQHNLTQLILLLLKFSLVGAYSLSFNFVPPIAYELFQFIIKTKSLWQLLGAINWYQLTVSWTARSADSSHCNIGQFINSRLRPQFSFIIWQCSQVFFCGKVLKLWCHRPDYWEAINTFHWKQFWTTTVSE